jgi:hypothetical protein
LYNVLIPKRDKHLKKDCKQQQDNCVGKDKWKWQNTRIVVHGEVSEKLLNLTVARYTDLQRHWFSGKIDRCHRSALGSIPGWRNYERFIVLLWQFSNGHLFNPGLVLPCALVAQW